MTPNPPPFTSPGNLPHLIGLALVLALLWLVLSGHFDPLLLGLGLFSVLLVVALNLRMELIDHETLPLHFGLAILPFWGWLLREVVLSNLDVIKRIWLGNGSIHPEVRCLPVHQQTDMGRVIYANSITLTPGTVTIDLYDDHVRVHALSSEALDALAEGEMSRRVEALER